MQGDYGPREGARPQDVVDCCGCVDATPARLFWCVRCRAQVLICSHCDRGQVYCADGCAQQARRRSLREAGCRYQASHRGRMKHAMRQRRWRAQKNKVTHQGSPPAPLDGPLSAGPAVAVTESSSTDRTGRPRWQCHYCGRRCPEFVRRDFLRRRRGSWNNRRGPRRGHSP